MLLSRRLIALALATTMFASCSANPASGRQNFTLVGEQQEYQMGKQTAEQEIQAIGVYNGKPELTNYIRQLGTKMWAQTERASTPVQVIVLDSDAFNAWAVPGYVNFYRGILPYFQNETQMAEVMGHEMGHINARHGAQGMTRGVLGGLALTAGGILIGATTNNDAFANIVTQVGGVGLGLGLTAYGRSDELEADRLALRYMSKSGYEPREAYRSHQNFELYEAYVNQQYAALNNGQMPPKGLLSNLTSTHPQTPDRAAQVKALVGVPDGTIKLPAGVQPATTQDDPLGRTRYLKAIDGLAYGPKPKHGIAGKNVVYFPAQRFVWRLPDSSAGGWVTDVTVGAKDALTWKAANPQGGVRAVLSFVPMAGGTSPVQALRNTYEDLPPQDKWQQVSVGQGSMATTAWTVLVTSPQGRNVRVVGVPIAGKALLANIRYELPANGGGADGALMAALRSGSVVSEGKAASFEPLKVRIRTSAGEPISTMAAKLPVGALNELWFRALNGLQPGESLPAGMLYKTVVDENVL